MIYEGILGVITEVKNGDGMYNNSILYGNGYRNEIHSPKVPKGDRDN